MGNTTTCLASKGGARWIRCTASDLCRPEAEPIRAFTDDRPHTSCVSVKHAAMRTCESGSAKVWPINMCTTDSKRNTEHETRHTTHETRCERVWTGFFRALFTGLCV